MNRIDQMVYFHENSSDIYTRKLNGIIMISCKSPCFYLRSHLMTDAVMIAGK